MLSKHFTDTDGGLAGRFAEAISAGPYHVCALLRGGSVACWGQNTPNLGMWGQTTCLCDGTLGVGAVASVGSAPGQMGDKLKTVDLISGAAQTL